MKKILPFLMIVWIVSIYGATGTLNNDVKIRELPTMKSPVVAIRKKGQVCEILEKVDTATQGIWYQTPLGYIYEKFITPNREEEKIEVEKLPIQPEVNIEIAPPILPTPLITLLKSESKTEDIPINKVITIQEQNLSSTLQDTNTTKIVPQNETKELILSDYAEALKLYKKKEYQGAYTILNDLFAKNLNDVNINFYLGRSGYELGLFDEAILAYDRILFENPDALRVQFELGRTYFAKESYLDGKKYFSSLIDNTTTPTDLKLLATKYLVLCEEKISKYKIGGVAIFGINYDSNINQSSKHEYLDNYQLFLNTTQKKGAWAHQEVGIVNYSYQLEDSYLLKIDGLVFLKSMVKNDLDDKNVKMGSIAPSINYSYQENLAVDYGVFLDNLWVGGENYIQSYGLYPKLSYTSTNQDNIALYLKYQIKNYQQATNTAKDSKVFEFGSSYTTPYSEKLIFIPNFVYSKEIKQSGSQLGIDNKSFTIGLNTNYLYSPIVTISPSLNYKSTKYDIRDEKQFLGKIGLTYVYAPQWIVQSEISYTTQTSNEKSFEFSKNNFGINLIRPF
jgi:tetratricopeptide (TPR) repeat protein